MSSIKAELSGKCAQEIARSFLLIDVSEGLDLPPRNLVQTLFVNAHAVSEPCETLPVELSEGDEIHQGAQGMGKQCDLRSQLPALDQFEKVFFVKSKWAKFEATHFGVLEVG